MRAWAVVASAVLMAALPGVSWSGCPPVPDVAFVSIPGGTFQMGDECGDLWKSCRPVHTVKVSSFRMSATEITNAQYCVFLNAARAQGDIAYSDSIVTGATGAYRGQKYVYLSMASDKPSSGNRCWITYTPQNGFSVSPEHANWPLMAVTWYGAKAFATYYGWDLPREAEWEYACRGGKQFQYGTGDGSLGVSVANCWDENLLHPVDVGSYPPNPLGLYDMCGNVWEWCDDWYGYYLPGDAKNPSGPSIGYWKIMRGGGWADNDSRFCRSAVRYYHAPKVKSIALGIRVVQRSADRRVWSRFIRIFKQENSHQN